MYHRLKQMREKRDISQREIAEILQTTQQQYSKYELGTQEIPCRHVITLANHYNVSTDYLLNQTDNPLRLPSKNQK